ncbi:hypothetical protein ACPV5U_19555 [Vibrio mediterranei]
MPTCPFTNTLDHSTVPVSDYLFVENEIAYSQLYAIEHLISRLPVYMERYADPIVITNAKLAAIKFDRSLENLTFTFHMYTNVCPRQH